MRKSITLSSELWNKISDYRFENKIKSESETVRILFEKALNHQAALKRAERRKVKVV